MRVPVIGFFLRHGEKNCVTVLVPGTKSEVGGHTRSLQVQLTTAGALPEYSGLPASSLTWPIMRTDSALLRT